MLGRSLFLLCGLLSAEAATIVSVSGPVNFSGSIGNNQAQTAGFTLGQAYANISISALIGGPADETFTAYLTTSIGPGTTVADEITSAVVAFPGFGPGVQTTVLSGLDLAAGTYYLTLFNSATTSGSWSSTETPVVVASPGSGHDFSGYFITNDLPLPYPPAGDFADLSNEEGRTLIYTVATPAEIPEPSTAILGVGLVALAALRARHIMRA